MPFTIITIGFDSKKECFLTDAINEFLKDKKIISAKEGFFEHNDKNYWTVFIEYEAINANDDTNDYFNKQESHLRQKLAECRKEQNKEVSLEKENLPCKHDSPLNEWKAENRFNDPVNRILNDQDVTLLKQFKAIFKLTRREEDVMCYLVKGKPNREIAQSLGIAVRTVKTHITNIYKKLGVANKIQMVNVLKNFNLF